MWFYIKLAWRNIFRNKRRTIIASIAIGIGLASLIYSDALMIGMIDNMIRSTTTSFLGEAQIHHEKFRETQEVKDTIRRPDRVAKALEKDPRVERFSQRVISFGMLTSPANASAILLFGIQPEKEKHMSKIDDALREGRFFEGDNERDIVIGSKMAEILEVSLGDRVVCTVSEAGSGKLSQEMFRVSAIYQFNINEMDNGMAFIRQKKAQEMLGLEGQVHQVAIKFKDIKFATQENFSFWEEYSKDGNEAVSWATLMSGMKRVLDMFDISLLVIGIILFGIVIFGIINTLFMSLYERMFEFGVIRAVGTRPWGVRKLILFEAGALGVVSIVLGTILGFIITLIFTRVGIDYRGIEIAGAFMHEIIYPVFHLRQFILYPVAVFLFTVLVGFYPALVAGRMPIAESLRKSL